MSFWCLENWPKVRFSKKEQSESEITVIFIEAF